MAGKLLIFKKCFHHCILGGTLWCPIKYIVVKDVKNESRRRASTCSLFGLVFCSFSFVFILVPAIFSLTQLS